MRSIPSSLIGSATASRSPALKACPRESGRRPARRPGAGRQPAHRSPRLPAVGRRAGDRRAARMVADDRRPRPSPGQALQRERSRLANRVREQLWRYYPQMLELADDLAAEWFLDLWHQAPTPAKAARLRETTVERVPKAHRIRRWQAPEVMRILRQKPLSVAPGVAAAASAHIEVVAARIKLVNQQLKAAYRKLDQLSDQLIPPAESAGSVLRAARR